jgi:5-methylcytosine-specific restriction endonuclease McrA
LSAYRSYGRRGKPRRLLRERLAAAQAGVCPICNGDDLTAKNGTLDHIRPKSRGGSGALVNLRLAHKKCNSRRGNSTDDVRGRA